MSEEWFESSVADCFITWVNILEAQERGEKRREGGPERRTKRSGAV